MPSRSAGVVAPHQGRPLNTTGDGTGLLCRASRAQVVCCVLLVSQAEHYSPGPAPASPSAAHLGGGG
jgi:hypothetical protein